MAAAAELSKRRKKKRKKRKQKPGQQQPVAPPAPPESPQYKHVLGYTDPGDGLVREQVAYRETPQTNPPPRPLPTPQSPPAPAAPQPFGVYSGPFGRVQAKRLLDRAGFGPRQGEALSFAERGMQNSVYFLTRPSGAAQLNGPAPVDHDA